MDGNAQLAANAPHALAARRPGIELELQSRRTEVGELRRGRRRGQQVSVFARHLGQQLDDLLGIAVVGHPQADLDAAQVVGQRPVHNLVGDELRVGHDHVRPRSGAQHAGTDADALDLAALPRHVHRIAHLDGTLEQHDETRDEVVDDALQAETDPDTECAGEDGESIEAHPGGGNGHQQTADQHHIVEDAVERIRNARCQRHPCIDLAVQHVAQQARDLQRQPDQHEEAQQVGQRHRDLPDLQRRGQEVPQRIGERRQQHHLVQGVARPQQHRHPVDHATQSRLDQRSVLVQHLQPVERAQVAGQAQQRQQHQRTRQQDDPRKQRIERGGADEACQPGEAQQVGDQGRTATGQHRIDGVARQPQRTGILIHMSRAAVGRQRLAGDCLVLGFGLGTRLHEGAAPVTRQVHQHQDRQQQLRLEEQPLPGRVELQDLRHLVEGEHGQQPVQVSGQRTLHHLTQQLHGGRQRHQPQQQVQAGRRIGQHHRRHGHRRQHRHRQRILQQPAHRTQHRLFADLRLHPRTQEVQRGKHQHQPRQQRNGADRMDAQVLDDGTAIRAQARQPRQRAAVSAFRIGRTEQRRAVGLEQRIDGCRQRVLQQRLLGRDGGLQLAALRLQVEDATADLGRRLARILDLVQHLLHARADDLW